VEVPAVGRARVALGPKALDIPTRPLGVMLNGLTASRRRSRYCFRASGSESILRLIAARCQHPLWDFPVRQFTSGLHIFDIMHRMGTCVFQGLFVAPSPPA